MSNHFQLPFNPKTFAISGVTPFQTQHREKVKAIQATNCGPFVNENIRACQLIFDQAEGFSRAYAFLNRRLLNKAEDLVLS